jgi:hypothetical protein
MNEMFTAHLHGTFLVLLTSLARQETCSQCALYPPKGGKHCVNICLGAVEIFTVIFL